MIEQLTQKPRLRIAGLMSGTSLDGLDIAVCDIQTEPFSLELVASTTIPMPGDLRSSIEQAFNGDVAHIAGLDIELGRYYAQSLGDWCDAQGLELDAIGSHGQTVFHAHGQTTLQLGEPGFLANRLNCPVIADFRRADIVAGGCGAPLVPVFDIAMFGREHEGVVALNIGGIANLTAIPALDQRDLALAFDTGPGNMVIDGLMHEMSHGEYTIDSDGLFANGGCVDQALLERLLNHPFLMQPPPRSAGREDFGRAFCQQLIDAERPSTHAQWQDLIATVTAWTALSIANAIRDHVLTRFSVQTLLVGGGGVHNATLMRHLRAHSNQIEVVDMKRAGVDPDMREAMAFAFLAERFIRGRVGNLPAATGARKAAVLGKLVLAGLFD